MSRFKINCDNCHSDKTGCGFSEGIIVCALWSPKDLEVANDRLYWFKMEIRKVEKESEKRRSACFKFQGMLAEKDAIIRELDATVTGWDVENQKVLRSKSLPNKKKWKKLKRKADKHGEKMKKSQILSDKFLNTKLGKEILMLRKENKELIENQKTYADYISNVNEENTKLKNERLSAEIRTISDINQGGIKE